MQQHGGVLAEQVILGSERRFLVELKVDWNQNGLFNHPLSDMSAFVDEITTDRMLQGSAPKELLLVEGASAAELRFVVAGEYRGLPLTSAFSPYNRQSPFYGKPIVNSEVIYRLGVETNMGVFWYPQFVGNIRTTNPHRADNFVEITALDRTEKLRKAVQLPAWAVSDEQMNYGEADAMVCRSHWVIDSILRLCDVGAGPKRPTFREEVIGFQRDKEGPQFFATGNGGTLPTWGRTENMWASSFPNQTRQMYVDSGPLHPAAPAGTQRPQAFAGLGLPIGQVRGNSNDHGILRWWVNDRDSINPYATHYFGFTLNTNGTNSLAYQSIGIHNAMEIRVGAKFEIRIQIQSGQCRAQWFNENNGSTLSGPWLNIPTGQLNVDIFAMWDFTATTGSRCYIEAGSNTTGWVTVGSPPNVGAADVVAGRVTVGQALSLSDIFYGARSYYGSDVRKFEAYMPVKYAAVLDRGKNRLTSMPSARPAEAMQMITDVAGAEFGSVFWDEQGVFRFWNLDTMLAKQKTAVRVFTTDDITDLAIQNSLDSVRNEYTVLTTRKRGVGIVNVYSSGDVNEFYVPPRSTKNFRLWIDDVISPWTQVMNKHSSDPLSGGSYPWVKWDDTNVKHGYCIQYLISNLWQEVNARTGADVSAYFTNDGYLNVKVYNGWNEPIRFANGAGDTSNPAFKLGGTKIVQDADIAVWSRNEDSIRKHGARNLALQGEWYQDYIEGKGLIESLVQRTSEPIPATDAIQIPGDPRLQLGDTVVIRDKEGFGEDIGLQILGVSRTFSRDGGLTDTLTVEMIKPGDLVTIPTDPDPGGEDPGGGGGQTPQNFRTNLLPNPTAIAADDAIGNWAASEGSGYVTSVTGMPRTTGYRMVAGANDGRLPFGAVEAGKSYTFSVYIKGDAAARAGSTYIKWISASDTTVENGPQTPWSVGSNQTIRASSTGVAPAGAVKARLYIKLDGAIITTAGMYEQSSSTLDYFDSTTPSAWLNEDNTSSIEIETSGGGDGGTGGSGDPTYATPGKCLNLKNASGRNKFNIGLGLPTAHTDYNLATIDGGFSYPDYWELSPDKAWVKHKVRMDGKRTSENTSYPRSELRELGDNGTSLAAWNGGSGTHYCEGESIIQHVPPVKPWVCFFQIHDASSDLMRVQTEVTSGKLGIVCRNTPPGGSEVKKTIMTEYTPGTRVKWRMEIIGGNGKVFLNGTQVQTFAGNRTGCYFKAGAYAQSNQTIDAASEYVEVWLRNLVQWHTGWATPLPPESNGNTNPSNGTGGGTGSGGSNPTDGTTAAVKYGWGTPHSTSDTFTYTGTPDATKWDVYGKGGTTGGAQCWPGHDNNGRRCFNQAYVNGEYMRITGLANGDTTGIAHKFNQQYGRWEVRARFLPKSGATGNKYHPVLIVWPESDEWPEGGEYDFVEVDVGATNIEAFLHYPHPADVPVQQVNPSKSNVDTTQWHNYGFEWTADGLKGYIDGTEWFSYSGGGGPNGREDIQDMLSGHLTIQLDNFFGASGMQEAYMDVQWARVYRLADAGTPQNPGGGGATQTVPGTKFDLRPWSLTIPEDGSDSGSDADEILPANLPTYKDANFYLDSSSRLYMNAPCQGATTSGSGGTRTEFREWRNGARADWSMSSVDLEELTVTGIFDPTSLTDRKEMIVGQIHGETGTPPIYLTVEHHVASPRLRLYQNGPGVANLITGLTTSSIITYRIRVQGGRVKLWYALGTVADLPSTPQYDWPATDFTDRTGCYFKFGAYNKSEAADGGTGAATSRILFYELKQGTNVYTTSTTSTGGGGSTPASAYEITKEKALRLTSTAENSTVNWWDSYDYIEDIKDGRGYTGGIVGFTSATGDMLEMVLDYYTKKPQNNPLATWRQGLINCAAFGDTVDDADYGVNGGGASTIANAQLGSAFRTAWATTATNDSVFRQCQRDYRERVYWLPAYNAAIADGLGALGIAIYYDTSVNHGPGQPNSHDGSFDDIRSRTTGTKPVSGGSEKTWLTNFMNVRSAVLTEWGDNPSDGRVKMFKDLINTNNFTLTTPFSWSVYGDSFTMSSNPTPQSDSVTTGSGGGSGGTTGGTMGKTDNGTGSSSSSTNKAIVSQFTATAGGTLSSGKARVWVDSGSASVRLVVYADSGGAPGALIAQSAAVTVNNTTEAEKDFTFTSGSITTGSSYWVGLSFADPGSNSVFWSRGTTAGLTQQVNNNVPNPFGTPGAALAGPLDVSVTFT